MNDPHGIVYADGRYHLFYQYVPDSVAWDAHLSWGHAVSTDLVHWTELAPALEPLASEVGCWSGSVVLRDGVPHLFYSRPTAEDWGISKAVLVRGDATLSHWERHGVVVDGPPSADFHDFRDPQVRRDGDAWRMTVGATRRGFGGCVLQFSSDDLEHWRYDGVLAERAWNPDEDLRTGEVWECPQFLRVDDAWVLIVSAMDAGQSTLAEVVYAIGDYDGLHFAPRTWGRFGHARTLYATTTFTDADGRACAMSWIRDVPRAEGQQWNGMQSLVHVLHVVDDRLVVEQHPNLDAVIAVEDPAWRVSVDVEDVAAGGFAIDVDDWSLVLDFDAHALHVSAGEEVTYLADLRHDVAGVLDVVVDAGIAEVTWSGGEGLYVIPVPDADPARVDVTTWP